MNNLHTFLIIAVISIVTIILRFLPFIIFKNKVPEPISFLGQVLPYAIMGMLVVYCLKDVSFVKQNYGIPELISVLLTVLLHKLKHNTLLSILSGTVCYMILIQIVF